MYVFILNPNDELCKIVLCAIGVGLLHIFIGATLMVILLYSIKTDFEDIHVLLCSFGYHFFTAEAILSLNYVNGWSTPMRLRHRRFAHVFLQLCAMVCAISGTVFVIVSERISANAHGLTGIIAASFAVLSLVSGPWALYSKKAFCKILHVSIGLPTFVMSSISLCLGLFTTPFKNWADSIVIYILLLFICFYTIIIVITPFIKCLTKM